MATTDDDIVHLFERCVDVMGRWAAVTLMQLLGRPAYVLDRRLGRSWRDVDDADAPAPSDEIRPRPELPSPGTTECADRALQLFAKLIDVLGRRAAVTLIELLQPSVADALDRRLAGWRDLAIAA